MYHVNSIATMYDWSNKILLSCRVEQMRTPTSTHHRISLSHRIVPRHVHSLHAGQTFSFQDRFYTVHSRTKRERRTKIHHHGREVWPSHHYTEWDASCSIYIVTTLCAFSVYHRIPTFANMLAEQLPLFVNASKFWCSIDS